MSWAGKMVERTVNAMRIGELEGKVSGLYEAIDSWREHAEKLEAKVIEYRHEAFSGWAYWRAAKKYIKNKYGEDIGNINEVDDFAKEFYNSTDLREEINESVERKVKRRFSS